MLRDSVRIASPAPTERLCHRRGHARPHAAPHQRQDDQVDRKDERHRGNRVGAEARYEVGVHDAGSGAERHHRGGRDGEGEDRL